MVWYVLLRPLRPVLKQIAREKDWWSVGKIEDFETHFRTVAQLYWLPHGILHVFNAILYETEFQNPKIFQQTISHFPEQSTLDGQDQR
jgi:hypothetical protein